MHLMDYRVMKTFNESTLLLVTHNGKECKTDINDMKPATTLVLIENAWGSFLNALKTNCKIYDYNLRLHS